MEKHKVGDSGFPVMLAKSMYLIISFSLLVMAAKETSVEKLVIFPNSCFKSVTFEVHGEDTTAEVLICRRFCVYMSGSRTGF